MERERRGWYSEMSLDFADGEPLTACLYKQPEDLEACSVAQFGQAFGGGVEVHRLHITFEQQDCNHKTGFTVVISDGLFARISRGLALCWTTRKGPKLAPVN